MSDDRRWRPAELLRDLALSLERLAAQGVASGAVRGAAEELRAELPDLDVQVRTLLHDALTVLVRLLEEAARRSTSPPGTWTRITAEAAVRGAVGEMRRLVPDMQPMTHELLARMKQWLARSAEESAVRSAEIRAPGDRARMLAAGAIDGAAQQLSRSLPSLAPAAAEFAFHVGRGLVDGLGSKAQEQAAAFASFLDSTARSLVHAIIEQLDADVHALQGGASDRAVSAVAQMAERTAAATVRGATEELEHRLGSFGDAPRREGPLRWVSREVSSGVLAGVDERLRTLAIPVLLGGALIVALVAKRSR